MKRILLPVFLLTIITVVSGCAKAPMISEGVTMAVAPQTEAVDQNRMLIWHASLSLEVGSVKDAVARVTDIAKQSGGYVESKSDSKDEHADLTLRIPTDVLTPTMTSLETIGKVTRRRVSSEDVTDTYVDIDARLKTKIALRDRLRALLDKAQNVQDILAIETELGRVQADIDSMQARLKALKNKVNYASINVSITRKRILGPLGYVLQGAWWLVEKLFIIQD